MGVEDEIDPMFDPVLTKEMVKKGSRMYINVSNKMMDYDPRFKMYFITRLPNPSFSPELQAKTTSINFTITQKGLEEQLLGKVISKEQKALEEQLTQVLEQVNANTKSLMLLDASLLERLTSNTGDLLDDKELVSVLAGKSSRSQCKGSCSQQNEVEHCRETQTISSCGHPGIGTVLPHCQNELGQCHVPNKPDSIP